MPTICDGPAAVERFHMIACLHGLQLASKGIRVSRRVSMLRVARGDYGIKAKNAGDAYIRMRAKMIELGIIRDNGKVG